MDFESPTDPRQALEASLTAMLLSELPEDQAAFLRQAIASDAELARMHERLRVTIGLVRETASTPVPVTETQAAALKLSEERRQALLQRFKTIEPKQFAKKRREFNPLAWAAAVAAVFVLFGILFLPAMSRSKTRSMSSRVATLGRQMDALEAARELEPRFKHGGEPPAPLASKPSFGLEGERAPAQPPAKPAQPTIVLPTSGELAYSLPPTGVGGRTESPTEIKDALGIFPLKNSSGTLSGGVPSQEPVNVTFSSTPGLQAGNLEPSLGSAALSPTPSAESRVILKGITEHVEGRKLVEVAPQVTLPLPVPQTVTGVPTLSAAPDQSAAPGSQPSAGPQFSRSRLQDGVKNAGDVTTAGANAPSAVAQAGSAKVEPAQVTTLANASPQDVNQTVSDLFNRKNTMRGKATENGLQWAPNRDAEISKRGGRDVQKEMEIAAAKGAPLAPQQPAPVDVPASAGAFRERYGLASGAQLPATPALRNPAQGQLAEPIDPNTGLPVAAAATAIDPVTGLQVPPPSTPEVVPLYARAIKVDTNTFMQGLESVVGFDWGAIAAAGNQGGGGGTGGGGLTGGALAVPRVNMAGSAFGGGMGGVGGRGDRGGAGTNDSDRLQAMARQFFLTMGLDLSPPKTLEYNQRDGTLTVRGTAEDLDTVTAATDTLGIAPPVRSTTTLATEARAKDKQALGFDWYMGNMFTATNAVQAQGGTAPPLVNQPAQETLLAGDKAKVPALGDTPTAGTRFQSDSKVVLPPAEAPVGTMAQSPPAADTLVRNGRVLYESGKLAEAKKALTEAVKQNPQNQQAYYYLNLISEAKSQEALDKRIASSANRTVDVENAWHTQPDRGLLPAQVPAPNLYARTNLITTGSPRKVISDKLDRIRLDSVGFDGLPLSEVLKVLSEESKKRDPEHRGINFLVNDQQNQSLSSTTIKIVPPLHDIRLADVLDAINKVADAPIKYSVEDYAVVFSAPPPVVYVNGDAEAAKRRAAAPIPEPQPETQTRENAFSTFSMNVSDVSFKLAAASLEKGALPDPGSIRSEEFINAFDYRDPEAAAGAPIAFAWERGRYPFAQGRDLLRFSLKTAAQGRQAGRPLNLVLLLDNSGSMERADRVQIIHEALRVLATQLSPQDVFSVVTFARTPRLWVDGVAGSQAAQVAEEVSGLTPQGGTNLGDALDLAYQTALRHYLANGINRVVLLTDGAANLGDVEPDNLKKKVETNRKQGIALDCFGIGWEGYNDDLLEVLTRNADGRYGFINTPEEAATEFAGQLAGALQVAANDVKVQVEFNPNRVTAYRQIGYAKLQLTKEQFRDNTVNAAQIGAAETGNALYVIEVNGGGDGPLGTARVRYRVPGTQEYREQEWVVPYTGSAVALEQSSPALRLAASASAFSEWLATSPYAGEVTPDRLLSYLAGVPEVYGADARPKKLEWMIRQAKSLAGK